MCLFGDHLKCLFSQMNDSLDKASFGRKHLRRRSSLFFKNASFLAIDPLFSLQFRNSVLQMMLNF